MYSSFFHHIPQKGLRCKETNEMTDNPINPIVVGGLVHQTTRLYLYLADMIVAELFTLPLSSQIFFIEVSKSNWVLLAVL